MGYYKVVRLVNDELKSSTPCRGGSLTYHRKKFTRMIPGSLGIFIFKDQWLAQKFAQGHRDRLGVQMQVFSCAIVGKAVRARKVQSVDYTIGSFIDMFRKARTRIARLRSMYRKSQDGRVYRIRTAPVGAYTVQAVRLKRLVRNYHRWD